MHIHTQANIVGLVSVGNIEETFKVNSNILRERSNSVISNASAVQKSVVGRLLGFDSV